MCDASFSGQEVGAWALLQNTKQNLDNNSVHYRLISISFSVIDLDRLVTPGLKITHRKYGPILGRKRNVSWLVR